MKVLIMGAATSKGLKGLNLGVEIHGGGWVENLVNSLSDIKTIELFVSFFTPILKKTNVVEVDGVSYIGLPADDKRLNNCTPFMKRTLTDIVAIVKPDVIHIIGTERMYNYELFKLLDKNNIVLSVTGLVSFCSQHYFGQIEKKTFFFPSIGDFLRRGGPIKEQRLFQKWGKTEKKLISEAKYVIGRTSWDYACTKSINPAIQYFYCGEILNPIYFKEQWSLNTCVQHSIFVSQGSYPLKGLHRLFEAFPEILQCYPDACIYIAGPDLWKATSFKDKIKQTTYAKYLMKLAKQLNIPRDKIVFTGPLSPEQMKKQYIKSNVFVMPSIIENSPNSLGEAMLLGMPCVASYVGGIPDMINHEEDGFLYSADEPYMLAYYIKKIFENTGLAISIGNAARVSALKRFNKENVIDSTLNIYRNIYNQKR